MKWYVAYKGKDGKVHVHECLSRKELIAALETINELKGEILAVWAEGYL